jgi:catechol 2,3-dioxygenase-like lactoylglutathione lyase family enzyme
VVGIGDTSLALFPVGDDDPKPPPGKGTLAIRHIAFRASRAGFVASQARLTDCGVPFRSEDHRIAHSIYCSDPNGHEIEITTYELDDRNPKHTG